PFEDADPKPKMIKPFQRQNCFTVFDNAVIDALMPQLSHTAWKVLSVLIRQTIGFQKEHDKISHAQLTKKTGINTRATLIKAVKELETWGIIKKAPLERKTGNLKYETNVYFLNTNFEINLTCSKNEHVKPDFYGGCSKNEQYKRNYSNIVRKEYWYVH